MRPHKILKSSVWLFFLIFDWHFEQCVDILVRKVISIIYLKSLLKDSGISKSVFKYLMNF